MHKIVYSYTPEVLGSFNDGFIANFLENALVKNFTNQSIVIDFFNILVGLSF